MILEGIKALSDLKIFQVQEAQYHKQGKFKKKKKKMKEKHFKIHSNLTIEKDRLESLQTEEMTYKRIRVTAIF